MCSGIVALSQNKPGKELSIRKATSPIQLDGVLNEQDWQSASVASGFYLNFPVDSIPPTFQSEVKVTFDETNLYIGIVCYDDSTPNVVQSLRRDFDWGTNDNFGIFFDPYNDYTNGFYFVVTPQGVQQEGLLSNGASSEFGYSSDWDNKWYSKVQRHDDRWIAEIAIPFKSIRYNVDDWNMTFVRNDVKRNQVSSWIATPVQFLSASFAYAGKLVWEEPLPKPGTNISLIPYVAGSSSKNVEENKPADNTASVGLDAKIGLTPSLNLDLTVNPDFSQVEVDRQVVNLTRFEFGFPERRQFFLENSDLFAQPGFPDSRPFFSRRIGLASDSAGNTQKVPILYGARVSGKLGKDWRIGVMNMQTRKVDALGLPDQNYSVGVVQRQLGRSNLGFVFVNKQSLGLGDYDSTKFYHNDLTYETIENGETVTKLNKYNRVLGLDFNLNSKDNRWSGDIYYHHSLDARGTKDNYSGGAFIGYTRRNYEIMMSQNFMGKDYNAEAGFTPRIQVYPGYYGGFARVQGKLFPTTDKINIMRPSISFNYNLIPDGTLTDRSTEFSYGIDFANTSTIKAGVTQTFQLLTNDFNPISPEGDSTLLSGDAYSWTSFSLAYQTNRRNVFNATVETNVGGFYNGSLFRLAGQLNYRYQPFGSLSVRFDYNDIRLPEAYGSAKFFLIGPRLDITFTDKLFLTTFVQYNSRADNVNLNARFQWRYQPASDFFIVYTENYLPDHLHSKNRALVLKFTYWLNI